MKNILLQFAFVLMLLSTNTLEAQTIMAYSFHPSNPDDNDAVRLVLTTQFRSGSCLLVNYYTSINGNSITLTVNYQQGMAQFICDRRDTLFIGNSLPCGQYTLQVNTYSSGGTFPGSDNETYTFNVSCSSYLISAIKIDSVNASGVDAFLGISDGQHYAIDTYKILYNTTDAFNNPTIASGALMIPVNAPCTSFPLLSFAHGTVLKKSEVPSQKFNNNWEGYYFSSKGNIVVMPDYLGLGNNTGFHPYLHALTEATATIDLMRAAKEFLAAYTNYTLDGKVFITGFSQGGHAAMATLKYIQDNNLFSEFNVTAGAPMSGPYSLSIAEAKILGNTYLNNAFIPYVINSYQNVYGNLYSTINAYYKSPYNVTIPPYLDGTHSLGELNSILPTNAFGFMQDSVLNNFIADTISFSHPLRHDLKLNDNYSWTPAMPLRLSYCGGDDVALPENSTMAYESMIANGANNVSIININPNLGHVDCEAPSMADVRAWFNTLRTDCNIFSCDVPGNPKAVSVSAKTALISWATTPSAVGYELQYHETGNDHWRSKVIHDNAGSVELKGLKQGRSYEWRIRAICSPRPSVSYTAFSSLQTFSTLNARLSKDENIAIFFQVYPNPTNDLLNVTGSLVENGEYRFELKNILGETMFVEKLNVSDNVFQKQLSIAGLESGMYFLIIENTITRTVVKINKMN